MEIQISQIIFQIINFGVVAGALTYLLYKPVQKILDERSKRIEEGQVAAQKAITQQEEVEELKKNSKKDAEKEAAKILEEAKKEADKRSQELLDKAQDHAKAQVLKFQAEWQEQKKELVKELKGQFVEAVMATSSKVVGEDLDKKTHAKLIDAELAELLKTL